MIDLAPHDLETIKRILVKHIPGCEVRAFGSRVSWTSKSTSDIDLAIIGDDKIPRNILVQLKADLEDSAIVPTVDILDWHRISPGFRQHILKQFEIIQLKQSRKAFPEGWKLMKVSEFADVVGGGTPSTKQEEFWNGDIPWLTPKDLSEHQRRYISQGARNISRLGLENSSARLIPTGAVLLTSRAPVGYVAIAENPLTTNQGFRSLVVKEKFHPEFICYLLLNSTEYLQNHASGSTFQEISGSTLSGLDFLMPTFTEQKAIAHILGSLDDKIELNRGMNETLEAMARAIFKSWFVDFDPVRAKMGGYQPFGMDAKTASLFPDSFQDSPLGKIPKGWRVESIENLAERVAMGPFGSSIKVSTFVPDGIPVISGQHLNHTLLEDNQYNFISSSHAEKLKNSNVFRGDVVFTHAGSIGQVGYIPKTSQYERYVISQRQFYMRCNLTRTSPLFIIYFFKTPEGQHRLLANTSSTGVPSISRPVSYLRTIKLSVPTKPLTDAFDKLIRSMHLQVSNNITQSKTIAALRDTLIPKLISSQIRVKDAEKFVEVVT